ncbi:hypothetical protein LUX12_12470 [Streptomyces somaliensis]|nr:hypothetical protein [Streptomyces somaliensis]MCP9945421.1 hypothetical protein [Streptomyces somaliensis]MCP9974187.1 hypothetical protein [Streptomyces somaliensis]
MPGKPSNTRPSAPFGNGPGRWNDESGTRPNTTPTPIPPRPRPTAS